MSRDSSSQQAAEPVFNRSNQFLKVIVLKLTIVAAALNDENKAIEKMRGTQNFKGSQLEKQFMEKVNFGVCTYGFSTGWEENSRWCIADATS